MQVAAAASAANRKRAQISMQRTFSAPSTGKLLQQLRLRLRVAQKDGGGAPNCWHVSCFTSNFNYDLMLKYGNNLRQQRSSPQRKLAYEVRGTWSRFARVIPFHGSAIAVTILCLAVSGKPYIHRSIIGLFP